MVVAPLLLPGVKVIVAELLPPVTPVIVGAPGTAAGIAEPLGVEVALKPTELMAVTLKVYAVPLVRPVKIKVMAVEPTFLVVGPVTPVAGEVPSPAKTETW